MVVYKYEGDKQIAYSDSGYYIHGGNPEADYIEAVDPIDSHRTYVETNLIDPPTVEEKAEAYDVIVGEVLE